MIDVPVYSDQELTPEAAEVINAVINSEFPKGTFNLYPADIRFTSGEPALVFGKLPIDAHPGTQYIHTYSIAQIMSKPNAASALVAALQQFGGTPINVYNGTPIRIYSPVSIANYDFDQPIVVDIETSGNLDMETPEDVKLLSIGFYQPGYPPMVLLASGIYPVTETLRNWLRQIKKPIFHNAKFDVRVLENQTGVRMKPYFDTMLAHHVLNQGAGQHALKPLARRYLGAPEWEKDLSKYTRGGAYYEYIPDDLLVEYNGWDVYWTYRLYEYLKPLIDADENAQSVLLLEMSASDFLLDVERRGFKVDVPYALKLEKEMSLDVTRLEHRLKTIVDPAYNPGSWQQTKTFLSNLGHYVTSTNEESLTELKAKTNDLMTITFIDTLLEYRGVKKALKTYVQGALDKADFGERVHTTFLIHGTTTGRLSSTGPNIQNIPRDKKFRSLYIG